MMYVYVIGCIDGHYKVGKSKSPARRLIDLSRVPVRLEVLTSIPTSDADWLEKYLHRSFRHCVSELGGREWFRLNEQELAAVLSIPAAHAVCDLPRLLIDLHGTNKAMFGPVKLRRREQVKGPIRKLVKLDGDLIRKAKTVAAVRGISMAAYLEAVLAGPVAADFKKETAAAK